MFCIIPGRQKHISMVMDIFYGRNELNMIGQYSSLHSQWCTTSQTQISGHQLYPIYHDMPYMTFSAQPSSWQNKIKLDDSGKSDSSDRGDSRQVKHVCETFLQYVSAIINIKDSLRHGSMLCWPLFPRLL